MDAGLLGLAQRLGARSPESDDQNLRPAILDLFKELNARLGQTIVMITHNPEAAAVAHRVIEMKDGRVLSHGMLPHLVTGAST